MRQAIGSAAAARATRSATRVTPHRPPLVPARYGRPADVYSFAMVLVELLTHRVPFVGGSAAHVAAAAALRGARPTLPLETPPAVRELVVRCWSAAAELRPAFEEVKPPSRRRSAAAVPPPHAPPLRSRALVTTVPPRVRTAESEPTHRL